MSGFLCRDQRPQEQEDDGFSDLDGALKMRTIALGALQVHSSLLNVVLHD